MKTAVLIALAAAALAGCVTPFRAPSDVAHVQLSPVDSPVVIVEKIWLERKNGSLAVTGYVLKRLGSGETTQTHLDVTLYDAAGAVLRTSVAGFEPQRIIHRPRHEPHARYNVPLDPLPVGTARIEVRAHEGAHVSR